MIPTAILLSSSKKIFSAAINNTRRVLWFLARDAFLFSLALVLLAIVFGEFLYYNYVLLIDFRQLDVPPSVVTFQEKEFTLVVKVLEKRKSIVDNLKETHYSNPF